MGTTPARGTPRSAGPNYTPPTPDGGVEVSKATDFDENWQHSRQYWAYLKDQGLIADEFISGTPHMTLPMARTRSSGLGPATRL